MMRWLFSLVPRGYVGDQYRRFSTSFPISKRTGESMGLGGFVGRAAAVALGYGIVGPHFFGDIDLEFAKQRLRALERVDEEVAKLIAIEETIIRNSKA